MRARWPGSAAAGRGRIGNCFESGDLVRRELDVVVFAGAEVEPDAALDLGVMVAALDEAVAQRDPFGGARRQQRSGEDRDGPG